MKSRLHGWTLVEGRIPGQPETASPSASQVVAAIEAVVPEMGNPYVILVAPPVENTWQNYCQTLAMEEGYCCEIRIYGATTDDYRHYRLLHPDEFGNAGSSPPDRPDDRDGYHPDLRTALSVFAAFMGNPLALPEVGEWEWIDVREEVDAQ